MKKITYYLLPRYIWFLIWFKQWFKNPEGIKGFADQVLNLLLQATLKLANKLKKQNKRLSEKIREKMPNASITSDFIVGFPGETDEQFLNTVKIVQDIEFDGCNTAAYSPRPDTPAAIWENQIAENVKNERLRYLNSVVNDVLEKKNKKLLNTIQEVLVEGRSQRNEDTLSGRTRTNVIVNFDGDKNLIGNLVNVKIKESKPWSLNGEVVS